MRLPDFVVSAFMQNNGCVNVSVPLATRDHLRFVLALRLIQVLTWFVLKKQNDDGRVFKASGDKAYSASIHCEKGNLTRYVFFLARRVECRPYWLAHPFF